MKRVSIIAMVLVSLLPLYKLSYPTYSYSYRMTVNVEVEGKVRSDSSVIKCSISKQPRFLPDVVPYSSGCEGEAVFVDLGGGRNLVALLASGEYAQDWWGYNLRIVPDHFKLQETDKLLAALASLHGKWDLSVNELPTLVTFSDPNNPGTWKGVRSDQLELTFGANVRWRGVQVEMTTDAVTHKIESRLPWITKLGSTITSSPRKFTINGPYFKR